MVNFNSRLEAFSMKAFSAGASAHNVKYATINQYAHPTSIVSMAKSTLSCLMQTQNIMVKIAVYVNTCVSSPPMLLMDGRTPNHPEISTKQLTDTMQICSARTRMKVLASSVSVAGGPNVL